MEIAGTSKNFLAVQFRALCGWLLVFAWMGVAGYFTLGTLAETEKQKDVDEVPPFAQTARIEHGSQVVSLNFSPDGTRMASATVDGDIFLTDMGRGGTIRLRSGKRGSARSLIYSPDGRVLAVAGAGSEVELWDCADEFTELDPIVVSGGWAMCLAFSKDGSLLAIGQWPTPDSHDGDYEIALWDYRNRRCLRVLKASSGEANALAISPDGTLLASGHTSGDVLLWDTATGQQTASLTMEHSPNTGVAFAMDGTFLATAAIAGPGVRLWHVGSWLPGGILEKTTPTVFGFAWSADGRSIAIAEAAGVFTLWDTGAVRKLGGVTLKNAVFHSVAFTRDGRQIATGDRDGAVRLWDVAQILSNQVTGEEFREGKIR